MATAASSTPPPVSIPAPLSLMHAIVSQNSLAPLQAVEKRLGNGLTLEERISLTIQLNIPTGFFCLYEALATSRDQLKPSMDDLIRMFNLPQMKALVPLQVAFEDAQISRHLEVLRVAWDAILAMETAPKTEVSKGLSSRPLHGYSRLREADCSLPLYDGQGISCIDFTLGCLTPQASQLCPPVLTVQDMYKEGQTGVCKSVVLELQSLTLEQQRGHYSQVLIAPTDVVTSLPGHLDFILPQPITAIVQSYLVPTTREQRRLYLTTPTSTWSNKEPHLFPYPPAYISSTQSAPKASCGAAEPTAVGAASASTPESTATKASSAGTTILSASGVATAASSSSAGALALPETVDAATTFPWIQAEIDRLQGDDGQANPRFEGNWIAHDTLWVIACVVFDKQNVIMLSHPNMGRALSYKAKAKDEYGYELVKSLGVTTGHIWPEEGKGWAEHTPLVEQFAAFTAQNKAKGEAAAAQAQSTPSQGQTDDSKLYMSVATNPRDF